MYSPVLNRRSLLGLFGAAASSVVSGEIGRVVSDGVIHPGPPGPPVRNINFPRHSAYRPVSLSDPGDLPHLPADARLVRWRWARSSHRSLQDAFAALEPGDILVLPEDEKPFEIDTSRGFQVTSRNYYSMAATTRGVVGLGPGTVVRPSVSAFHRGRQTYMQGLQEKLLESRRPNAYFANFTMQGRDFGGLAYNATWASGAGTTWERIFFQGAHRGFLSGPPGEAGAICGYRGRSMRVYNCEIDCRDQSGRPVGTSPVMWNSQSDVVLRDVYAHHTYTGMPAFWRVHNASVTNLIHTDLGHGLPHSPGVNVEQCTGTFIFDSCTFIVDYGKRNHGLHLQTGGQSSSVRFQINNPTIDSGPWPGKFAIQQFDTTAQRSSDFTIRRANGAAYPYRVAH